MSTIAKATIAATSRPTYPPSRTEQISSKEISHQGQEENREGPRDGIIAQQPRGGNTMNAGNAGEGEAPLRLRGGCIPCPGGDNIHDGLDLFMNSKREPVH
ncbi:hypothetical protein BDZ94DRAFT_613599 [Collybia nuda]|uniref:Uncharacterized protein n=1 Tax=Collybia nuda TaxID=64659 RepID=A0A9P6CK70_9AGAR|nr:hypothetical protein BDZ94DRAFT_613599 [Collybia nuda]